jgi:hypothetical protein
MPSIKELILSSQDIQAETVEVPEWGCKVVLRGLTGRQRDQFEEACRRVEGRKVEVDLDNVRAKLLVRCMFDDSGARVFADDDADALGNKSGKVLARLVPIAQRLSGLSDDDVKELAAHLPAAQSGASTSV